MLTRTFSKSFPAILLIAATFWIGGCSKPAADNASDDVVDVPSDSADDTDDPPNDVASDDAGDKQDTSPEVVPSPASDKVTLTVVDKAGYDAVVAKQKGKVVLVDFWATWCLPCRAGFPKTVELHEKHAKEGLAVISVSMEFDPETDEPKAIKFLESQKATFINLLDDGGAEDEAFEAYDIVGGIPHYKLYDKTGKLVKTFGIEDPDKPIDHEEIAAAVKAALGAE